MDTKTERRYATMEVSNDSNRLDAATEATGLRLVCLVDEKSGGIIGYLVQGGADRVVAKLNEGTD